MKRIADQIKAASNLFLFVGIGMTLVDLYLSSEAGSPDLLMVCKLGAGIILSIIGDFLIYGFGALLEKIHDLVEIENETKKLTRQMINDLNKVLESLNKVDGRTD